MEFKVREGNSQLDVGGIRINGEEYSLKIINSPQNNGNCNLELCRKNGDKYCISIERGKVKLSRNIASNDETLVQLVDDDLGGLINANKGDIFFESLRSALTHSADYKQLEFPFFSDKRYSNQV